MEGPSNRKVEGDNTPFQRLEEPKKSKFNFKDMFSSTFENLKNLPITTKTKMQTVRGHISTQKTEKKQKIDAQITALKNKTWVPLKENIQKAFREDREIKEFKEDWSKFKRNVDHLFHPSKKKETDEED